MCGFDSCYLCITNNKIFYFPKSAILTLSTYKFLVIANKLSKRSLKLNFLRNRFNFFQEKNNKFFTFNLYFQFKSFLPKYITKSSFSIFFKKLSYFHRFFSSYTLFFPEKLIIFETLFWKKLVKKLSSFWKHKPNPVSNTITTSNLNNTFLPRHFIFKHFIFKSFLKGLSYYYYLQKTITFKKNSKKKRNKKNFFGFNYKFYNIFFPLLFLQKLSNKTARVQSFKYIKFNYFLSSNLNVFFHHKKLNSCFNLYFLKKNHNLINKLGNLQNIYTYKKPLAANSFLTTKKQSANLTVKKSRGKGLTWFSIFNNPFFLRRIKNKTLVWKYLLSKIRKKPSFFSLRLGTNYPNNIIPNNVFNYRLKKHFLQVYTQNYFTINVVIWYHTMLVSFIENVTGLKSFILFNPFLDNLLSFLDNARSYIWAQRLIEFKKTLGPKIYLLESLKVLHIALRLKDPSFFSSWVRKMLKRVSFWKYRFFFRYIKYLLRYLFYPVFKDFSFKGIKLKLKGKISVAGNSRTRKILYSIGKTTQTELSTKVLYDLNYVYTFTGIIGLQIWFFF